jgi:hypothetical protein
MNSNWWWYVLLGYGITMLFLLDFFVKLYIKAIYKMVICGTMDFYIVKMAIYTKKELLKMAN